MKLPGDLSVFQMLESRLDMLGARQKSVAENVANANTPGYVPKDVDQTAFRDSLARVNQASDDFGGMVVSNSRHYSVGPVTTPGVSLKSTPDSEVTMDGNAVVVEEQMLKINQIRADFDTAIGLYQKGLSLIRMAARSPN